MITTKATTPILRRCATTKMFRRIENYRLVPTTEELARRFLGEVLATVSGYAEPAEAYEALREFFLTLKPFGRAQDFDRGELPVPDSLRLLTSGLELHLFFRAWLRKRGRDPETGE